MNKYSDTQYALLALSAEASIKKRYAHYDSAQNPAELFDDLRVGIDVAERCLRMEIGFVTIADEEYPESLRGIDCAPLVLYYRGDSSLFRYPHKLALVGTRKPTRYGKDVTKIFVKDLCARGVAIVSGMARGIDTCAHATALENDGKTIAVVASGLDLVYPAENLALAKEIISKGLMVGEYPPGTSPLAFRFPERNRIISGLCEGVLIPEAGEHSGSMITANDAVDQGRELFVVPGSIFAPQSAGCNRKIKELQASIVTQPSDIAEALGITQSNRRAAAVQPTIEQQAILTAIGESEKHISELMQESGWNIGALNALLCEMEILGMIRKLSGNYYAMVPKL